MNWFAIRRSLSSSLRNEAGPVRRIANRPPHPRQLISQLISPSEVLMRPRLLPLRHQPERPLVTLSTLLRLGKGAETDELEHLRHGTSCRILRNLAAVRFPNQLKNLGESPRRIEVISQSLSERLEPGPGGGVAGPSPQFARRPLPLVPPSRRINRVLPKEVPKPLDPGNRFLHLPLAKSQRLPVMPRDQISDHSLTPVGIERSRELKDVAFRFRHLRRPGLDHPVVHPEPGKGAPRPLGLGDLVLVVGEDEVRTATVDGEGGAQLVSSWGLCAFQRAKSRRSCFSEAEPASSPWSMSSGRRFESLP